MTPHPHGERRSGELWVSAAMWVAGSLLLTSMFLGPPSPRPMTNALIVSLACALYLAGGALAYAWRLSGESAPPPVTRMLMVGATAGLAFALFVLAYSGLGAVLLAQLAGT